METPGAQLLMDLSHQPAPISHFFYTSSLLYFNVELSLGKLLHKTPHSEA